MSTPTNRPPVQHTSRGVTFLELMVVLVVIGLLSGLAVVKYNTFQRQAELRSSAQKLYQIFGWARLESEKRGDTLLVQLSTLPEVGVYVDQNGDGFVNKG
ncbi:MAG TPA: prepilin-type N-terminal cleavage/methylation domain-containing protein, partial [Fibrobacteria bacterium]|nr:prepilin-type N-terminal cleavage/methylation domain-containing protein [Fibrobacteria bacterium]